MREAGEAGGHGPGCGRPCQFWRVSPWPPGWFFLKWAGIGVNQLHSAAGHEASVTKVGALIQQ